MDNTAASFEDEHEAFAASRVSQYVFVPTKDLFFNTLDQHADTLEGDVKPPLVLVGNEGSGKSALLANWVAKRREHKHRDEFLFQHFVGCTSQSLQLMHTLFRLETALKDFFQLREMKVPDTEVELRWSLNRFLEAASKKHSPARIIIIIDGISRLKADGAPDGALHWLPTELPPCVRFIVSTVEFERNFRGKKEGTPHRTFVELARRQCPILKIEPLGVTTRHSVINTFFSLFPGINSNNSMTITEAQQFKIVTAASSAQPMYLRTLLQALRLVTSLTKANPDDLLEKFLSCTTAHELIDKNLNICCEASDPAEDGAAMGSLMSDMLGKMLSVVYVSRSGLTEAEIWGLMRMVAKEEPTEEQAARLMTILKDFTMVVNNMHTFSHEIYREVVYHKYISSKESLIRWHNMLARFFGQLPPCDRKLVALPYHLEMAGSWSKVKNCLTEIEMFQLWWTPKFKLDFIKFWASLTRHESGSSSSNSRKRDKKSNENVENDANSHSNRPTYDIVEEYVKSLDEYRNLKHPTDEQVAGIILEISDFLLEFATLGHEQDADVPALVHPKVLPEDLKAVGVPYIETDEDGRCSLVYPEILQSFSNKQQSDDGPVIDVPTKAIEDVPVCTTYFFYRWMWIQFPYIALGNCASRYFDGVNDKINENSDSHGKIKRIGDTDLRGSHSENSSRRGARGIGGKSQGSKEMSKSWSVDSVKLPKIKFHRKAARTIPRLGRNASLDEAEQANNKVAQRIMALQDNIQNYREELDFVTQMESIVRKRLQDLKDAYIDLKRTEKGCHEFDSLLDDAIQREAEGSSKLEKARSLNKNLGDLQLMCERHPANVPALITELQEKLKVDEFLVHEMKKRLWEQRFERQAHQLNFRHMKNLVKEAVVMQNKLLEHRYALRKNLTQQVSEDEKNLQSKSNLQESVGSLNKSKSNKNFMRSSQDKGNEPLQHNHVRSWEETWSLISSRTGIIEPEAFFQRINNGPALVDQIATIKKTSEGRLDSLKKEVVAVESELEEVRYEASFAGIQSSKEHKKQLGEKQQRLRHVKEKTEAIELLEQRVVAGLAHISDILFIPKSEDDAPVFNLVRDIESVLDTLINEREKQLQQQQGQGHQSGLDASSRSQGNRESPSVMPDVQHTNRSPELDFVIAKHESPIVRLPDRLPGRPGIPEKPISNRGHGITATLNIPSSSFHEDPEDENEEEEVGMWDRTFVKTQTQNNLKKVSKNNRTDAKKMIMASTV